MIDAKTRIQQVEEWLLNTGYLFEKSIHNEDECVFLVYEKAIYQAVLEIELTVNNKTADINLLCNVAPFFPQTNLKEVELECKKLSFIQHPYMFYVMDESVLIGCDFANETQDFVSEILVKLELLKDAADKAIPPINYVIYNTHAAESCSALGKE